MSAPVSPARFISFEGGEGAGKSTQAKRLAAALESHGLSVCLTREPGGSAGAEQIRALLVEGEPGRWDVSSETLLMFAARVDHLARTIRPALAAGRWVVCDRFTDSTYAYQGAGRGLDAKTIAALDNLATCGFMPDLTFILDVPVKTGLSRAGGRHGEESRFEQFDKSFHGRLRDFFHALAAREPARCILIDSTAPVEDVSAQIWHVVSTRFGL
ncbi:MAG TPA: dTMP kinase [Rhizomicrobium sp.]|jgi:dTMP kinase